MNFVTAHDGFTLRDLVSYEHKHNEANGEDNRDGTDNNRSWNYGVEGETDDPEILALRRRQAANMMVTLCLSNGSPMLTAGDERGRTQRGNNNAYCQDNEISWVDWRPDDAWLDVYDTAKTALRLRREHPALRQRHHFAGAPTIEGGPKDLAWLHPQGREMTEEDWHDDRCARSACSCPATRCAPPARGASSSATRRSCIWFNAGRRGGRRRAPRERVGAARRGRALDRPGPRRRARRSSRAASSRSAAGPCWCCARPPTRRQGSRRASGGQRDDAELGGRGQQVVLRDDPDGVAERAGCWSSVTLPSKRWRPPS